MPPKTEDEFGRQIHPTELITTMTDYTMSTAEDTSEEALAANPDRVYGWFQNDSNTAMYLQFGADAAIHEGALLTASGGWYEINASNMYRGAVNVRCVNEGKVLLVLEGT